MQRFIFLHYFLCIATVASQAQGGIDCTIQQYSTENGLPSNGIKGLQYDEKTSFLWLATEAGIVRFNGVDFETYTSENMPAIASERMMFITRSNRNQIFISDMEGNIFTVHQNSPAAWWQPDRKMNPFFDNYFLFSVTDEFFKKQLRFKDNNNLSPITGRTASLSDTSCVILQDGSLYHLSISLEKPEPFPYRKDEIKFLYKIGSDCFLLNDRGETFKIDPKNRMLEPVIVQHVEISRSSSASTQPRLFWEMGMNSPVHIDNDRAYVYKYINGRIIPLLMFSGIPTNVFVKSVSFNEKNKLLFIGTESRGLIVVSQKRVLPKKRADASPVKRNSYYSQIELSNGNILTNEGDVIGESPGNISLPIKGGFSFNITITGDSILWFNQVNENYKFNCLHRYDYRKKTTTAFPKIRSGDLVTQSGSAIYLANSKGIGVLDADSFKCLYNYRGDSFGEVIFDFGEISPGKLFLATCEGLLGFDQKTRKLDTLFRKKNTCIRTVWKYGDYVFLGTYGGGFYIMKNGKVKSMPLDKNKFLLYTHCFVPDNKGYCWISTNRGLFKASISDLVRAFDNDISKVYYHYLGKNDGMDITEMNGGCTPCALVMKNNAISFPTMDGLLWVDPLESNLLLPEGNIYIDKFLAGKEIINFDSLTTRQFSPKQNNITIRLGYASWCNKENIYLEYQLNNEGWTPVDVNNGAFITISNLPAGNYKLKFRKLNGFGSSNYSYKELRFSIQTPWYQRWWFYALAVLLLWAAIVFYLRLRTRQYQIRQRNLEKQVADKTKELKEQNEILEKNNTIKSRLISIISHDIITPLKFVTVAGKNLIQKRKMMPEELQQETISEMTNTTQELQLLSTNILNWIKYQNENRLMAKESFNVYEMVNQVLGILASLAKQKGLLLENNVDQDHTIRQYYEPLKILVYNLLTNAIYFTEKGRIEVWTTYKGEEFILSVRDEGSGMSPDQVQRILADQVMITSANVDNKKGHGLGYLIIKDLVKTMGATIHIESQKGKGTTVSVSMPVGNMHTD